MPKFGEDCENVTGDKLYRPQHYGYFRFAPDFCVCGFGSVWHKQGGMLLCYIAIIAADGLGIGQVGTGN